MSLQAILEAIRLSGEEQIRAIEQNAYAQVRQILAEARLEAQQIQEEACTEAAAPSIRERARLIHRARLEFLRITGSAREALVDAAVEQTRGRLAVLRAGSSYPAALRRLTQEALAELAGSPGEAGNVWLEADPRDRELLEKILPDLGLELPVSYELDCRGGLAARSEDERVVVINTLEARLERALPYLRRYLAAMFEEEPCEAEPRPARERGYV
jgi:vacuolar-type H+-ATPase subunit E/Vma4